MRGRKRDNLLRASNLSIHWKKRCEGKSVRGVRELYDGRLGETPLPRSLLYFDA
jgi:hypothetical protein